ncbi:MAG: ribosome biogenesis GTPase YlqF [Oscillospiraceae bacterium]|jgi:ribosome biogenesis GTPase A
MNVQWYPGHMKKTRRMIEESLKLVDAVCELLDARIPVSSRNPDIDELTSGKPRLVILNRADQADPDGTRLWSRYFSGLGCAVMTADSKTGAGVNKFPAAVKSLLREKIASWEAKGQSGRTIRVMVVGVPNVGKSSFINRAAGRRSARAEDRPGVTRGRQWITVERGLELLDTPGILWPKFEDEKTGLNLAFTGAVKDEVIDTETLAMKLCQVLLDKYPQALQNRYGVDTDTEAGGWEILRRCAIKRGFLISGGEADLERMSRVLLDEFRGGKLGRITLELPEDAYESK